MESTWMRELARPRPAVGPPTLGMGSDQGRVQELPLHGGLLPTQGRPNQGDTVFPLSLDLPQSWTPTPLPTANKPGLRIEGGGYPCKGQAALSQKPGPRSGKEDRFPLGNTKGNQCDPSHGRWLTPIWGERGAEGE